MGRKQSKTTLRVSKTFSVVWFRTYECCF